MIRFIKIYDLESEYQKSLLGEAINLFKSNFSAETYYADEMVEKIGNESLLGYSIKLLVTERVKNEFARLGVEYTRLRAIPVNRV